MIGYWVGRLMCKLGMHRPHPDPDQPHVYWCERTVCRWVEAGHP